MPADAAGRERAIHLPQERGVPRRQHDAAGRAEPLADRDFASHHHAPRHAEHRQRRRQEWSDIGLSRDARRRRHANHEQPPVVAAQFVGVEQHLANPPSRRERRERQRHRLPRRRERAPHLPRARRGAARRLHPRHEGRSACPGRSRDRDRQSAVAGACCGDAAVGRHTRGRREHQLCDARHVNAPRAECRTLQVAQHVHLTGGQRLGGDEARRASDRGHEVQALRRGRGAVHAREQRLARARARHAVREHEPKAIARRGLGERRTRQRLEARFRDMVIVAAIQCFDMQRDPGIHRESLKPFLHQFGVERDHRQRPDVLAIEQVDIQRRCGKNCRPRLVNRSALESSC